MTKVKDFKSGSGIDDWWKVINEHRKIITKGLNELNKDRIISFYDVKKRIRGARKQKMDVYRNCQDDELKKRGITNPRTLGFDDETWDEIDDTCLDHPEFIKLEKKVIELNSKWAKLAREIEKTESSVHFPLGNDVAVTLKGNMEYNGDAEAILIEASAEVDMDGRRYWWKNVFDFGDIHGKEGCPASWYVDMEPDEVDPKCIPDEVDRENLELVSDLFSIGIRM